MAGLSLQERLKSQLFLSCCTNVLHSAENGFKATYGHSKEHRPDLKKMVLHLATTGASAFPTWLETHSGNASHKVVLQQAAARMKALCRQLKEAPSFLYVADSAVYKKCVLEAKSNQKHQPMHGLSRVPHTIKEANLRDKNPALYINDYPQWMHPFQLGQRQAAFPFARSTRPDNAQSKGTNPWPITSVVRVGPKPKEQDRLLRAQIFGEGYLKNEVHGKAAGGLPAWEKKIAPEAGD